LNINALWVTSAVSTFKITVREFFRHDTCYLTFCCFHRLNIGHTGRQLKSEVTNDAPKKRSNGDFEWADSTEEPERIDIQLPNSVREW